MRRPVIAVLAAALSLSAVIAVPALAATPAGASASTTAALRPHTASTTTPMKGIAVTLGYPRLITDARAMVIANELFSMISNTLHANAVQLNFAFWQSSTISNDPRRSAFFTPSPQRLMAITAVAHRYHLAVQWRPYLYEPDLLPSRSHNSIKPTNATVWMENYWKFLLPYLQAASLSGAYGFSIALELRSLLPHLSLWIPLVQRAKAVFSGQIIYSQQHLPQVTLPLTARGYDAYQPITLASPTDVTVGAFTRGFEHNLKVAEMNSSPADLTLEEVGLPAQRFAYLQPSNFRYPPGTRVDRKVQTDWYLGACNAFYQLHLRGIFYYAINFNHYTPHENQSSDIYGFLGTPSATAIAQCYARTPNTPAQGSAARAASSSVTPALGARARRTPHTGATLTWNAAQPLEPAGGHPTSVSCPTIDFCAEVDLSGDVLTETAGQWSLPVNVDTVGLVSVSCASATLCVAVDEGGNALSYNGSTWIERANVDSVPMTAVSCVALSTTCIAVDVAGRSLRFSAGVWSAPSGVGTDPLTAVSCRTTTYCVAVDGGGDAYTYTGQWTGATVLGVYALTSVDCPSTTLCVAGDDTGALYRDVAGVWSSPQRELALGVASISCAAASRCVALGATNASTTSRGSAWTPATPAFTGDGGVSISCAPLGACTAVAFDGSVAVRDNRWNPARTNDPRPGNLTGVSCGSVTFCAAVDDAGNAMLWDGSSWSAPTPTGLEAASAVSCAGKFCIVVSVSGQLAEYYAGVWRRPTKVDSSPLTAVSCVSPTFCAATDASNRAVVFNGLNWSRPSTEGVPQNRVRGYTAVTCVAPAFCVAVDTDGGELFFGSAAAPLLFQAGTPFVPLTGISCASSSLCIAIDEQGREVTFSASGSTLTWSKPERIDPYRLTAVSCTSDGYCLATDDNGGTVAYDGGTWSAPSDADPLGAIGAVSCVAPDLCAATDNGSVAFSTATL